MAEFKAIIENLILYLLKVFAYFEIGDADPEGFENWLNGEDK